ncbi:DUF2914 domain-containing protein [Thiohalophilus sp.]|uniref:DUF2914 domain-containing protein n=1 Tax=Thiohalophilus sp. TaxID=3028392 RepID=UPI0039767207
MKAYYGFTLALLLASGQLVAAGATDEQNSSPYIPDEQEQEQSRQNQSGQDQISETPTAAMEQSGFSSGSVMRSAFTTRIENREPADNIDQLENDVQEVYYFTELRDMKGQTARHRWKYQGEVMAEVEFDVKGSRWRVWSSKRLMPDWTGEWSVSVVNAANEVIAEDSFEYVAQTEDPAADETENTGDMENNGDLE